MTPLRPKTSSANAMTCSVDQEGRADALFRLPKHTPCACVSAPAIAAFKYAFKHIGKF
jgi:hypothetical protein